MWSFNLNAANIMGKIMNLASFLIDALTHPTGYFPGNNQAGAGSF
jgi:hypothetical protein